MHIEANGLLTYLRLDGPIGAPPLVLLHSLGTSGAVWDAQTDALANSFRVIRPDLRGHGLTDATSGPYEIETLAADVLAVLDTLGVAQAHVAGLSIGGMVAQSMAARAPVRVASLILCDTAMSIPPAAQWHERAALVRAQGVGAVADAVLARWLTPEFANAPAARGLRRMLLCTPPEGYAAAAEAIAAADLKSSTSGLRLPALVLVGDRDESTPLAAAEALRDAVPGSSLEVIEGAAHIPTVQRPEPVTDAIRRFLQAGASEHRFLQAGTSDLLEAGMQVRRQVLGAEHVDRALEARTDFDRDFQSFITRTAWGGVWTRPGLDRRTRSLLTLALLAALGHHEEFRLHLRATRNTGASQADVAEMLIQVAAYAGIPAANSAVRVAKETLKEMAK